MKQSDLRLLTTGVLVMASFTCGAQVVYKCESKGAVTYSHEPCMGASVVDTTPTQGLDKSSGQSRKGADVRNEENNKAMAEVLKPLLGESPEQRSTRIRRFKLSPADRFECENLDGRLAKLESGVRNPEKAAAARAEVNLFESRKRFRELRC